jgi:hypothetical protein
VPFVDLPTAVLTELTITASRIILLGPVRLSPSHGLRRYIGCGGAEKATARISPRRVDERNEMLG